MPSGTGHRLAGAVPRSVPARRQTQCRRGQRCAGAAPRTWRRCRADAARAADSHRQRASGTSGSSAAAGITSTSSRPRPDRLDQLRRSPAGAANRSRSRPHRRRGPRPAPCSTTASAIRPVRRGLRDRVASATRVAAAARRGRCTGRRPAPGRSCRTARPAGSRRRRSPRASGLVRVADQRPPDQFGPMRSDLVGQQRTPLLAGQPGQQRRLAARPGAQVEPGPGRARRPGPGRARPVATPRPGRRPDPGEPRPDRRDCRSTAPRTATSGPGARRFDQLLDLDQTRDGRPTSPPGSRCRRPARPQLIGGQPVGERLDDPAGVGVAQGQCLRTGPVRRSAGPAIRAQSVSPTRRRTALTSPVTRRPTVRRARSTVAATAACGGTRIDSSWWAPRRSRSITAGCSVARLDPRPPR